MIDYQKIISQKASEIKPSGIRKFFDLVSEGGDDIISLTVGQPDFVTPWHIREVAIETLEKGRTYYTSNSGLTEMRSEISNYLKRRFDLEYDYNDEIIVTVGGSEAIDLAIRAIVDPGDEVIIPLPSFVCYEPITQLVGGTPVIINTRVEDKFKLTPDQLKKAITPKTKALVLPFPNNPTGAIMTREELEKIADVLRGTDIVVISDEIYAELTYGRKHVSIASIDGMRERTIVVNGFSKAYAMTGWRMGYLAAPRELIAPMLKIHQYAIMCAPTISQYASIEALKNGDDDIEEMKAEYDQRRKLIVNGLRKLGIECFEPEGAFYVFPKIGAFGLSSEEFSAQLLNSGRVAIVPGTAFGDSGEGFARISYAYSVKHLTTALERIETFVKTIK